MKNRRKINAKSKLEKVMPKRCQYDRKWVQNRAQIGPKIDEKTHAKNQSKKYCENFEKVVGRSGKNSKKGGQEERRLDNPGILGSGLRTPAATGE